MAAAGGARRLDAGGRLDRRARPRPEGEPLEHVYAARGTARRRLRARTCASTPARRSRSPRTSTTSGRRRSRRRAATVYVAWADFRNYNWDIFSRALRRRRAHLRARTCRSTTSPASSASTSGRRSAIDPLRPRARGVDRPARARARHQHLLRAQRRRRRQLLGRTASSTTRRPGFDPEPRHAHQPVAPEPRVRPGDGCSSPGRTTGSATTTSSSPRSARRRRHVRRVRARRRHRRRARASRAVRTWRGPTAAATSCGRTTAPAIRTSSPRAGRAARSRAGAPTETTHPAEEPALFPGRGRKWVYPESS